MTVVRCCSVVDCIWNVMARAQKSDFVFRRNGRVHLNQRGRQFSRLLAAEVCASAVVILDTPCSEVVWRVLATHSIRQFPLHFPSPASPCAIRFQTYSTNGTIYRVTQEECAKLREGVPYVKVYRYNPKYLCPNLKGHGDNGQRILKLWQLLHTYWLPNTYWNWQEYVVSVMLISVLNIKLTCEWHQGIKLNYKNARTHVIVILSVPSTIHDMNAKHWRVLPYHQEGST